MEGSITLYVGHPGDLAELARHLNEIAAAADGHDDWDEDSWLRFEIPVVDGKLVNISRWDDLWESWEFVDPSAATDE